MAQLFGRKPKPGEKFYPSVVVGESRWPFRLSQKIRRLADRKAVNVFEQTLSQAVSDPVKLENTVVPRSLREIPRPIRENKSFAVLHALAPIAPKGSKLGGHKIAHSRVIRNFGLHGEADLRWVVKGTPPVLIMSGKNLLLYRPPTSGEDPRHVLAASYSMDESGILSRIKEKSSSTPSA